MEPAQRLRPVVRRTLLKGIFTLVACALILYNTTIQAGLPRENVAMPRARKRVAIGAGIGAVLALAVVAGLVLSVSPSGDLTARQINTGPDRVAIKGYDAVAYFTLGRAVEGKPEFDHLWRGARWRFANARHRDLFAENPNRFAPQYGGYCALGVALGKSFDVDPKAWTIVDGKLFLNHDIDVREEFRNQIAVHVGKADALWSSLPEAN